jgi:hypothetical protein
VAIWHSVFFCSHTDRPGGNVSASNITTRPRTTQPSSDTSATNMTARPKTAQPSSNMPDRPLVVPKTAQYPGVVIRASLCLIVVLTPVDPLLMICDEQDKVPTKSVSLYSNSIRKSMPVCATLCPGTGGNWIDQRIVERLKLESHRIHTKAMVRRADVYGKHFESTGRFVDFACCRNKGSGACRHRFYVAQHVDFDVVFGADILSSNEIVSPGPSKPNHGVSYTKKALSTQEYYKPEQQSSSRK